MRIAATPTLAIIALTLSACSAAAQPLSDDDLARADAVVVAEDLRFVDPPTLLGVGENLVALVNEGRAPHDLTFEGEHGTVVEVPGRGTAMETVTLQPGTYVVYCAVGGHRQAGMEFQLDVKSPGASR